MIHPGRPQSNLCLLWKVRKDIEAWRQKGEVPDWGDERPRGPGERRHGPRGRGDALLQHHGPRQPPLPLPHMVRIIHIFTMVMTVSTSRSPALPVSVSTLLVGCQADLRADKLRWHNWKARLQVPVQSQNPESKESNPFLTLISCKRKIRLGLI